MSQRKTHLHMSLYTLGGDSYIGLFDATSFTAEVMTEEGAAISERYSNKVPVKKKFTFSLSELLTKNGNRQSNLNLAAYSIGGAEYVGAMDTGSIEVSTETDDGSGDADVWEYPNNLGTSYTIKGKMKISTNALVFQQTADDEVAIAPIEVIVEIGGEKVVLPMTLQMSVHDINRTSVQSVDVTLDPRGEPDGATDVSGLLAAILTGTAAIDWATTTGAGSYSGTAVILSTSLSWANKSLVKVQHEFQNLGAPTIAAAS